MIIKPRSIILGFICLLVTAGLTFGGFYIFDKIVSSDNPETQPVASSLDDATTAYSFDYSWADYPYIAHALGGINGDNYTNSREAFLYNYELGHRVFEIDLALTEDGQLASIPHNLSTWRARTNSPDSVTFTSENISSRPVDGKYHLLFCPDIASMLQNHPDIYLMTDSKDTEGDSMRQELSQLVNCISSVDTKLLDRVIVQIYHPGMLDWLMELHPWKSVVYTLYANPDWTPENVLAFAKSSGVKFVTMWANLVTPDTLDLWQSSGIKVGAHTVNDLDTANQLRSLGVNSIYTDFLLP